MMKGLNPTGLVLAVSIQNQAATIFLIFLALLRWRLEERQSTYGEGS